MCTRVDKVYEPQYSFGVAPYTALDGLELVMTVPTYRTFEELL